MSGLLVDTSAYSAFKVGQAAVVEVIRGAETILIPATVLGELLAGFELGRRRGVNRSELREFLASPRVRLVPITADTAERYALIYTHLRSIGRPIPTNDLWIAASTMEHGAELLTLDAHFLNLPQIMVNHISPQ